MLDEALTDDSFISAVLNGAQKQSESTLNETRLEIGENVVAFKLGDNLGQMY